MIYLLNLTAGIVEIPDILPLVGNIDEATATAILLACARYFGYDLSKFLGKKGDDKNDEDIVDIDK